MHIRKQRLLTPGPTPLYPKALHAMMGSDIHHRTEDFRKLYQAVLADLKEVFGTRTTCWSWWHRARAQWNRRCRISSRAGDKVVVCSAGKFGERWAEIVKAYGLDADCAHRGVRRVVSAGARRAGP